MIYLASRSHIKYLSRLRAIANDSGVHDIVSITGGLAFFHALSPSVRSLVLVDCDEGVNHYASCIIELIAACPTRWHFFEYLSGHITNRVSTAELKFKSNRSDVRNCLSNEVGSATRQYLSELYPIENFDCMNAKQDSGHGTVYYYGINLKERCFNWLVNWGAFESEASYQILRDALLRLQPKLYTQDLASYNFKECAAGTVVLASNTDSPLFTYNDSVLQAIESSGNAGVCYISRTRDFSKAEGQEYKPLQMDNLYAPLLAVNFSVESLKLLSGCYPHNWQLITVEQFLSGNYYDLECLALFFEDANPCSQALIEALHTKLPIHQRLLMVANKGILDYIEVQGITKRYHRYVERELNGYRCDLYLLKNRLPYTN